MRSVAKSRGNIPNMRGKRVYLFKCRCCDAEDLREKAENKRISRELRESTES